MTGESGSFDPMGQDNVERAAIFKSLEDSIRLGNEDLADQIISAQNYLNPFGLLKWMNEHRLEATRGTPEFTRWNQATLDQLNRQVSKLSQGEADERRSIRQHLKFDAMLDNPVLANDPTIGDNKVAPQDEKQNEVRIGFPYNWETDSFDIDLSSRRIEALVAHPIYKDGLRAFRKGEGTIDKRIEAAHAEFARIPGLRREMTLVFKLEIYDMAAEIAGDEDVAPAEALWQAKSFLHKYVSSPQLRYRMESALDKVVRQRAKDCFDGDDHGPYSNPDSDSKMLITVFASSPTRAQAMMEGLDDD